MSQWLDEHRDLLGLGARDLCRDVVTCPANELIAAIHDRMPVIIAPEDRNRWIGEEADPSDLMKPYPARLMTMGRPRGG